MTKDESNSKHMETESNQHSEGSYFESRDRAFSRGSSASSTSASSTNGSSTNGNSANGNSPNGHSTSTINGDTIYEGSANGRTINGDRWSESWDECFSYEDSFLPEYHQMSLSVSRMEEGEQTDIRIHRETGKSTEVYVSQGGESWDLSSEELHQLPKALRKEVECLLNPFENSEKSHWWSSLFSFGPREGRRGMMCERQSETLRDKSREPLQDKPHRDKTSETTHGSSEKMGSCGKSSSCEK